MTTPAATRPPRAVGRMIGVDPPDSLLWVGTVVTLHDGREGVVQPYEFFWERQTDFPVKVGPQTLLLSRQHLRADSAPSAEVPAPRRPQRTAPLAA